MSRFGYRLEEDFAKSIFGDTLDTIVEWVTDNLAPEDVFSDKQLEDWAKHNGYTRID